MRFDSIFDNLLISSPNGGGLFCFRAGELVRLDAVSTTGIDVRGDVLVRGVQPDRLGLYGQASVALHDVSLGLGDVHDVLLTAEGCHVVGTTENVVLSFDAALRLVARRPLASVPDSIHINCLALWQGGLVYSAFGDFTEHRGYKDGTAGTGFVRDLATGRTLIAGLSQPHSLVACGADLLLANSETGEIAQYDAAGRCVRRRALGGYTRGIAVGADAIFVGLSCSRNADHGAEDHARVLALSPASWETMAVAPLPVKEIYDMRCATRGNLDTILRRMAGAGIDWPDWQG